MRVVPLASGSRGNATLVEFGRGGLFGPTRLLVDAGLSARELERRLEGLGVPPASIDAVLLSHEHDDHARGIERFSRRHRVPVLCTRATLDALDRSPSHFDRWHRLQPGSPLDVGGVVVEPFSVPHDAADPLGFVLSAGGVRFGIATDLGHATPLVVERLRGCDVLMIESNHDDRLLQTGCYPWQLKQRVAGRLGHLSNHEAAALIGEVAGGGCRFVVLAHLSEHNNTRELAQRCAAGIVRRLPGPRPRLRVAATAAPSDPLCL